MRKKVIIITVLGVLLAGGIGCSQSGKRGPAKTTGTPTVRAVPDSLRVIPATAGQLKEIVKSSREKVILLNIWATWCQPCREEFPDLMKLYRNYKSGGLGLILVSADFESELPDVRKFLHQHDVGFPTYFKQEKDMAFINELHREWTGALPATFVYGSDGTLLDFWQGKASYAKLDSTIMQYL